ncbi:class F sortase [Streptomyces sp. NPDC057638]|uniref:class F sortase n=1 Tax=Streptomyces sp. NPDC057638 TaxID=3346190 RepID=UPI00368DA0AC
MPRPALFGLALGLALLTVTACGSPSTPEREPSAPPPSPRAASPATPPPDRASTAPAPVHVTIPSVEISAPLMRLGLNRDQTVEVPPPEKGMTAGWYTGAAVPGEPGASVIIGHNATRYGKAVFQDLRKVRKGAEVTVRNAAGALARFTVTRKETVRKKAFPTERVYGAVNGRELRLITCDGAFGADGHTVDNLIVYAVRSA